MPTSFAIRRVRGSPNVIIPISPQKIAKFTKDQVASLRQPLEAALLTKIGEDYTPNPRAMRNVINKVWRPYFFPTALTGGCRSIPPHHAAAHRPHLRGCPSGG